MNRALDIFIWELQIDVEIIEVKEAEGKERRKRKKGKKGGKENRIENIHLNKKARKGCSYEDGTKIGMG